MKIYYCVYEGNPTIVAPTRAAWFVEGKWQPINRAEAGMNAAIIGDDEYKKRFAQVPPPPKEVLQDG